MAVHRFWMIPCGAALLLASGCLGSSSAHAPAPVKHKREVVSPPIPSPRYARFEVRGVYATSENHISGHIHRAHFTLMCASSEKLLQNRWQSRLCKAILDFQAAPRRNVVCACPLDIVEVSIRGEIGDRRIYEQFSYCMCGDGKRAARDTRVVLTTHPPFQTANGGA
jgi:hypothetical protein